MFELWPFQLWAFQLSNFDVNLTDYQSLKQLVSTLKRHIRTAESTPQVNVELHDVWAFESFEWALCWGWERERTSAKVNVKSSRFSSEMARIRGDLKRFCGSLAVNHTRVPAQSIGWTDELVARPISSLSINIRDRLGAARGDASLEVTRLRVMCVRLAAVGLGIENSSEPSQFSALDALACELQRSSTLTASAKCARSTRQCRSIAIHSHSQPNVAVVVGWSPLDSSFYSR